MEGRWPEEAVYRVHASVPKVIQPSVETGSGKPGHILS